ncbi:hypothetical protein NDI85_16320 [Halomicroarcula sp. S1AR25-4]|uniref:hypothetical protein n=1 Tax=Haloarcula sp. S1AR25-4 TaxID=2950538 RepID=UPI002876461B|nr:hypothetical protein [Halomicroarcula sp. S1AR25-4]MDS0279367.1 hypothetical protein [Halomicroarcula sp. S1AR25-4]
MFDTDLTEDIAEEFELERYRFSLVYVLSKVHVELGEVGNAVEILNDYRDEFQDYPLYGVLRGEVVVQQGTQEDIDDAFESIWKARQDHLDWGEVQKGTAGVITDALEQDFEYQGYNSEIPADSDSLLQKAKESIGKALNKIPDHPEFLLIEGRIQVLDSRFDEGRKTIRRAIKHLNPNRPTYDRVLTQYRIQLSNIDIQEQEHSLRDETTQAVEQLEEIREDYKQTSQRFQTQILQFLGFFTGLIGIVIISAQVAISLESTAAAIRVILVLIGGLLFAFGGFGFLLPTNGRADIDSRIFGVIVSGGILIAVGVVL